MKNSIESKIFTDEMTATIKNAVNTALLHHQAVGNKIAYWSEDKIVVEVSQKNHVALLRLLVNPINWANNFMHADPKGRVLSVCKCRV